MKASEMVPGFSMKESELHIAETPCKVSRPSGSAFNSRGAFSCRRWRLLSGKPSKEENVSDAPASILGPNLVTCISRNVHHPSTIAVDSRNWAAAATPFAACLPPNTIVPITSRKSVAAAILTSACPPENITKWDREMALCKRNHVEAMGRMTARIYRSKIVRDDPADLPRRQKICEKQLLKDQIYLPVLSQARIGGLRIPSIRRDSSRLEECAVSPFVMPDALTDMKLLSSQLDELRKNLEATSTAHGAVEAAKTFWCPQPQHVTKLSNSRTSQVSNIASCKKEQSEDSDSRSSSLETLLIRELEKPTSSHNGFQTDQETSTTDCTDKVETQSLSSRGTHNSEGDLLFLLSALDSTSQTSKPSDYKQLSSSDNSPSDSRVISED